jgi:hypothetical protein
MSRHLGRTVTDERMMRITEQEAWALHHARLAVKGPVLDIVEKWFTRNGWFFEGSEPAPPKDWQDYYHKVAELTVFISEQGDSVDAGFNSIDVAINRIKKLQKLNFDLEMRNARLSKFIMDRLGKEIDDIIQGEV